MRGTMSNAGSIGTPVFQRLWAPPWVCPRAGAAHNNQGCLRPARAGLSPCQHGEATDATGDFDTGYTWSWWRKTTRRDSTEFTLSPSTALRINCAEGLTTGRNSGACAERSRREADEVADFRGQGIADSEPSLYGSVRPFDQVARLGILVTKGRGSRRRMRQICSRADREARLRLFAAS